MDRPTPFELVFAGLAPEHFPPIREALAAAAVDPRERDAFFLTLPAMTLLRALRPDDTDAGSGLDELTALVHHAYLAWDAGQPDRTIPAADLRRLLAAPEPPAAAATGPGYIQFPERLIWASLIAPGPWEPLDGCFVHTGIEGHLRVLGIFGVHPSRNGFTVAEASGTPGAHRVRRDGSPLFAPSLDGGAFAGLHAVVEPEELVELAARALASAHLEEA